MARRPSKHDLCWTNHSTNAKVPGQSKLAFSWWKENSRIINSCIKDNGIKQLRPVQCKLMLTKHQAREELNWSLKCLCPVKGTTSMSNRNKMTSKMTISSYHQKQQQKKQKASIGSTKIDKNTHKVQWTKTASNTMFSSEIRLVGRPSWNTNKQEPVGWTNMNLGLREPRHKS